MIAFTIHNMDCKNTKGKSSICNTTRVTEHGIFIFLTFFLYRFSLHLEVCEAITHYI